MSEEPFLIPQTTDVNMPGPYFKSKCVCVYDNGLYPELAVTLARSFGETLYYSTWQTGFPRSNSLVIGEGLEGVTRVDSIWDHIDQIDLFVFPDILQGPLQRYLRRIGKLVWGSGASEALEIKRGSAKKWLRDLGLPVGPHRVLIGTNELRRHLQLHDNVYVKITNSRGDIETFHAESYALVEPIISDLEHNLGALKDSKEFVVEEPIETEIEVGFDGFTVNGMYPKTALFGIETKDAGYVGNVVKYGQLPKSVALVNQKLSPLFKDLDYRGFWSSEIRVAKDGTPYLIDPCCRMGSPPGELYLHLITNLADVIWNGAQGIMVEPEWAYPWGAQLILKSAQAEHTWLPLDYPPAAREHIKLHYAAMVNGRLYFVPQHVTFPEIGAVVAGGNSKQEAIKKVASIAETIRGYDIKFDVAALEKAADGMERLAA